MERASSIGMRLKLDRVLPATFAWSRILVIAFLASASFGVAAGEFPTSASATSSVSSPSKMSNDFDARLASDGKALWLATTGFTDAEGSSLHTQVVALKNGKWTKLPGNPFSSTDTALQIVARDFHGRRATEPCVGFTDQSSFSRIRCFAGGTWHEKLIDKSLRSFGLEGLVADGKTITAFFRKIAKDGATEVRVARMKKNDRFVPFGPPLKFKDFVLAQFGLKTTDHSSDRRIDRVSSPSFRGDGIEWVATLKDSKWSRSETVPKKGIFGLLTGSVRTRNSLYVPTTTGYHTDAWPLSIFRQHADEWKEVGDAPLSQVGATQGGIDPSGRDVWATWGEQEWQESGSLYPTKQWAARISPSGESFEKPVLLWSGARNFPGQQQTVEYRGKPAFLYIRQFVNHGPTRATVDFTLQSPND